MKIIVEQREDRDVLGFKFPNSPDIYEIRMLSGEGPKSWALGLRILADQLNKIETTK